MPTLVKRKPSKKAKPLQKQIDELTATVRHLTERVRGLQPQHWVSVGEDGEVICSPGLEEEMDRRFYAMDTDPSRRVPWEQIRKKMVVRSGEP